MFSQVNHSLCMDKQRLRSPLNTNRTHILFSLSPFHISSGLLKSTHYPQPSCASHCFSNIELDYRGFFSAESLVTHYFDSHFRHSTKYK